MNDDYAIIAGLDRYPGISDLLGAENDARAFAAWVAAQGVPPERVKLIVSSQFPRSDDPLAARPEDREIVVEFRALLRESRARVGQGRGPRVGRRLYIFFAGHGFVPDWEEQITALLTANASEDDPVHVAGRLYQRWAIEQGVFDEVLLFMDCCSTSGKQYPLTYPTFYQAKNLAAVNNTRWFYATASPLALKTREKTRLVDGRAQGVFTLTLLDALTGRAGARVTSDVLGRYLRDHMRDLLDEADLDDETIAKQPFVDAGADPFEVVALAAPAGLEVSIAFAPADAGQPVELRFGPQLVGQTTAGAAPWQLRVAEPGMYVLLVGGRPSVVDVTQAGPHVVA
ncbi:MAG: hypothetical protein U1F43_00790 [Myxococcota bacterium]